MLLTNCVFCTKAEILNLCPIHPEVERLMVDFLCWHVAPECFLMAIAGFVGCLNSGMSQGQGYLEPTQSYTLLQKYQKIRILG